MRIKNTTNKKLPLPTIYTKIVKHRTVKVPIYLIRLPIPYFDYCGECGSRKVKWSVRGFIKIKEKKKRIGLTQMDLVQEGLMIDWLKDFELYEYKSAVN